MERACEVVSHSPVGAVFVSAGVTTNLAELWDFVASLKGAAPDGVPVAVGGAIGCARINVLRETGADLVATDVREGLRLCGLTRIPA